jgi:hypothetical protein
MLMRMGCSPRWPSASTIFRRLATFLAALHDPHLGLAIAVAIALHNVPEGISVSVPIFYATGNRHKAFLYSFLSGLAEPVGAFIAYLALRLFMGGTNGGFPPQVMGILFSGVAGIMVYISVDELLPPPRLRQRPRQPLDFVRRHGYHASACLDARPTGWAGVGSERARMEVGKTRNPGGAHVPHSDTLLPAKKQVRNLRRFTQTRFDLFENAPPRLLPARREWIDSSRQPRPVRVARFAGRSLGPRAAAPSSFRRPERLRRFRRGWPNPHPAKLRTALERKDGTLVWAHLAGAATPRGREASASRVVVCICPTTRNPTVSSKASTSSWPSQPAVVHFANATNCPRNLPHRGPLRPFSGWPGRLRTPRPPRSNRPPTPARRSL